MPLTDEERSAVWHPFCQMQTTQPIPISKGKGVYLYAEDGRTYLDAISSWCVNLHGHAHPYICEKIQQQAAVLEHLIFADFTHAPAALLATRLLKLLPGKFTKVFYSDNGATAVEVALKMALQYWHNQGKEKKKIICFKNSYHGETFGTMSAAGKNRFNRPFWSHLFEVLTIDPPTQGQEEISLKQLDQILCAEDVACFLFEPLLLGMGGMIPYSAQGLDALITYSKARGVLTIADEALTGFGRIGSLFALEQLTATPDLICLAKGLTGGFLPLGATICTQEIFNAFLGTSLETAFLHGHSYTGNPLACTSALASLDLLITNECEKQREKIASFHQTFCKAWQGHPKVKRLIAMGTLLILEYHAESPSYFHSMRDLLYHFFLNQGILLRPLGNVLYILPPYCIQQEELESIYDAILFTLESRNFANPDCGITKTTR